MVGTFHVSFKKSFTTSVSWWHASVFVYNLYDVVFHIWMWPEIKLCLWNQVRSSFIFLHMHFQLLIPLLVRKTTLHLLLWRITFLKKKNCHRISWICLTLDYFHELLSVFLSVTHCINYCNFLVSFYICRVNHQSFLQIV